MIDPYGLAAGVTTLYWDQEARSAAHAVLEAARQRVHTLAPELRVSTAVHRLDPAAAIISEGRTAELIVLGTTHWRCRPHWLGVNVAARVTRRARGRVVIVGPDNEVLA